MACSLFDITMACQLLRATPRVTVWLLKERRVKPPLMFNIIRIEKPYV